MQEPVYEQLTLFQEDSRANRFPWLESKKEGKTTVIYGQRCEGLSPSLSHVGWWVRTYLESCELPLRTLSRTWKAWAITSSCWILKLRLSEHSTGGNESPLWPTVTTMDNLPPKSAEALMREAEGARKGRSRPANLRDCVQPESMRLWPTPIAGSCGMTATTGGRPIKKSTKLQTQVMLEEKKRFWPTQCGSEARQGLQIRRPGKKGTQQSLSTAVKLFTTPCAEGSTGGENHRDLRTDIGGQLNPTWVEWLMGFPIGWTELKD